MSANENALPCEEGRVEKELSTNSTPPQDAAQALLEAIRQSCHALMVDEHTAELIGSEVLPRLTLEEFPGIKAAVRAVAPNARIRALVSVHEAWVSGPVYRPLAEAQEIAASILSRYSGCMDTTYFEVDPKSPYYSPGHVTGAVRCYLFPDDEVSVFFTEAVAQ